MSQTLGTNVVPLHPQGPPQGMPQAGPPPGFMPNPAFAQWQQRAQAVQAVMAQNQQLQAQFDAAVALIKKDGIHGFRLDIEADSTIAPDEQAEKAARVEFLQQMVPLMQQVIPMAQGNPALASLAKEVALFAARGFRVARPLEEAFEKAFDTIGGMPPQPPKGGHGAQENPQLEQAKVAADVHDTQMRAQSETQAATLKAQTDQMAIAQKAQAAQQQAALGAQRLAAENARSQSQMAMQAAELQQRERLEAARSESLQARAARGLV